MRAFVDLMEFTLAIKAASVTKTVFIVLLITQIACIAAQRGARRRDDPYVKYHSFSFERPILTGSDADVTEAPPLFDSRSLFPSSGPHDPFNQSPFHTGFNNFDHVDLFDSLFPTPPDKLPVGPNNPNRQRDRNRLAYEFHGVTVQGAYDVTSGPNGESYTPEPNVYTYVYNYESGYDGETTYELDTVTTTPLPGDVNATGQLTSLETNSTDDVPLEQIDGLLPTNELVNESSKSGEPEEAIISKAPFEFPPRGSRVPAPFRNVQLMTGFGDMPACPGGGVMFCSRWTNFTPCSADCQTKLGYKVRNRDCQCVTGSTSVPMATRMCVGHDEGECAFDTASVEIRTCVVERECSFIDIL